MEAINQVTFFAKHVSGGQQMNEVNSFTILNFSTKPLTKKQMSTKLSANMLIKWLNSNQDINTVPTPHGKSAKDSIKCWNSEVTWQKMP